MPIDCCRLARMIATFRRNGGEVDQGPSAQAYLAWRNAHGLTFDAKTVLLPESPTTSAVFEEFIHTAQYRSGLVDAYVERYGNAAANLRLEMHAAEKLIRNRNPYDIPNDETRQTIERLRSLRLLWERHHEI